MCIRDRLEVPRPTPGVGDPGDVGLVGQQDLGVAGESAPEALGQAEHLSLIHISEPTRPY